MADCSLYKNDKRPFSAHARNHEALTPIPLGSILTLAGGVLPRARGIKSGNVSRNAIKTPNADAILTAVVRETPEVISSSGHGSHGMEHRPHPGSIHIRRAGRLEQAAKEKSFHHRARQKT